ncbi:MAG: hemerythrin domain-containing protein [Bacteroidota bacterium]|nr:hemerythrin domain-containing protein [Bacteroidota bacterium]
MNIFNKKIEELVDENYVYASVLYYFGIKFYDYSERTLEDVCAEKGLNIKSVISSLEAVSSSPSETKLSLIAFPVDLVIEYLKHSHYIFIKQKLPYVAKLIENLPTKTKDHFLIVQDLKLVFPLFVEDFIHHIYEEEDSLFSYILLLNKTLDGIKNPAKIYYALEEHSLQAFATEHEQNDDEMKGLRSITHNYSLQPENDLHLKVIFAELKSFEENLISHARIENEILFPKALELEKEIKKMLAKKIKLN